MPKRLEGGSDKPFIQKEQMLEERNIGQLKYKVRPREGRPALYDFGSGFLISSEELEDGVDLRGKIFEEADSPRGDDLLYLPENTSLEEGGHGWVFFTLPVSGIRCFIHPIYGNANGRYWVEVATPEAMAAAESEAKTNTASR